MLEMAKGGNVALNSLSEHTGSVVAHLSWGSESGEGDADVSAILLDASGKVRGDADFVFYNNPTAADGSVQLLGKTPTDSGSEDRITLDLAGMQPEVAAIAVAASRYDGGGFSELSDLRLRLTAADGEDLLGFSVTEATTESAFVLGELYRREGAWKFRAVGQGYDSGLAGLAADLGIDIEDDAAEESFPAEAEGDDNDGTDSNAPKTSAEVGPRTAFGDPTDPGPTNHGHPPAPGDRVQQPHLSDPRPAVDGGTAPDGAAPAPREAAVELPAPSTVPAPTRSAAPAPSGGAVSATRTRPRTARRKVTLPKPKKSLAENDSWRYSRLFPVSSLRSDREREGRATSVLLSVMSQVPEFGRRLTAGFGAPAGRMETFTEVSLPHGSEPPKRPDGVIRVERAGKLWTALVETKTNGNQLRAEQVQDYMDIAARRGYEAVITLSNDVALEGSPLVDVRIDGRRRHRVALWHLSWAEVAHQAQMLIGHEGVSNAAHAWLLQELLMYLQHEHSGCHGFQNMGPAWVPVRNGIDDETLGPGDPRAADVVESWERLVRQVSLRLGGELGRKVLPAQRKRRGQDPQARRAALADQLCRDGRLTAELRIEGMTGILALRADLRTGKLRASVEVPAPEQGYPLTWAKQLVRRLAEAPADVHVETLVAGEGTGPRSTLERLRPEPGDLLPTGEAQIVGFRLSLFKGMGNTRGNSESSFIRSVDDAVDRFIAGVVLPLERGPGRRPRKRVESPVGAESAAR